MKSSRTTLALLLVVLLCVVTSARSQEAGSFDYLHYAGDEKRGRLETATVTMQKGGITVDLIGAIHIADAEYYKTLSDSFKAYDALLFELVDGQKLKRDFNGDNEVEDTVQESSTPGAAGAIIHGMMKNGGAFLKLAFQSDGIDYHAKNFVHADVSWARFVELQEEMGESWGSLMQQAMSAELERQGKERKQPEVRLGMLIAGIFGDPSAMKVVLAKQMASMDDLSVVFENENGQSVIIGERNKRALEVLEEQLKAGKRKLGIFYGAGHMPDMEKRMAADGWKRVSEKWVTAWKIEPKVLWKKEGK